MTLSKTYPRSGFRYAHLKDQITPWTSGCNTELQLCGKYINLILDRDKSTRCEMALSTIRSICLFCKAIRILISSTHSRKMEVVIRAFLMTYKGKVAANYLLPENSVDLHIFRRLVVLLYRPLDCNEAPKLWLLSSVLSGRQE